tara:strand:- start:29903 stop:30859 length:957 start_codon:yes stop_codon:yes gene_type:complete
MEKLKRILAIVVFIILLIVGLWSAIQVITFVPSLFNESSTGSDGAIALNGENIVVQTSRDTVYSGETLTIDWVREGSNEGVVSFAYGCTEGVYFEIAQDTVPCNVPFTMAPSVSTLTVVPFSSKEKVDVAFAITYTDPQNKNVRDTKTITIIGTINDAPTEPTPVEEDPLPTTPVEPPATYTPQPIRVPRTSVPYGVADLQITNVRPGVTAPYGQFETKQTVSRYETGAVKFTVTNSGTKTTNYWYFRANLPVIGGYEFVSEAQPPLTPGSSLEILITFDQLAPGVGTIVIRVDPYNYIPETNEYNNTALKTMNVLNF